MTKGKKKDVRSVSSLDWCFMGSLGDSFTQESRSDVFSSLSDWHDSLRDSSDRCLHRDLQRTNIVSMECGMMTWHDFVAQLLLILAPAAILTLIKIDRRR